MNNYKEKYFKLKPGEIVESVILGRAIKKRTGKFSFTYESKNKPNIERLVVKIFYEFLYLVNSNFFFERIKDLEPIYHFIDTGINNNAFHLNRIKPKTENYEAVHFVYLLFDNLAPRMTIGFFGKIVYKVILPIKRDNFWANIEKNYNCQNIKGIHFEQDLEAHKKRFWLMFKDGSRKFAGEI